MFWGKKSIEDKIKAKVKATLSKKVAELINNNLAVCIEFDGDGKIEASLGDTKYGGSPHFITADKVPVYENRPLKLLAQINCKDLSPLENFPHEGMLYVFMDVEEEPTAFPEKRGQFKVLYIPMIDLSDTAGSLPEKDAYKLIPIQTYSIHENQSYIFDGIDVPEEDVYKIIDLQYGLIAEIVGQFGSQTIGGVPDMQALWGWAYQHLGYVDADGVLDWKRVEASEGEAANKAEQILKDFELVYTTILDSHGHTDSWIHIGIHKEDLKNRNFSNVYATFVST